MVADVCTNLFSYPQRKQLLICFWKEYLPQNIYITGNTVVDACYRNLKIARKSSNIMSQLELEGDLLSLTLHRAENVDDREKA